MMKNRVLVAIFLIGLIGASTNSWAHGGRLNSEGCHNDSKAGAYHCHRSSTKSKDSSAASASYNRDNWKFRSSASPVSSSVLGWYTGIDGSATDVDHVVALKDAYLSGEMGETNFDAATRLILVEIGSYKGMDADNINWFVDTQTQNLHKYKSRMTIETVSLF